jgi:hypothetical protein
LHSLHPPQKLLHPVIAVAPLYNNAARQVPVPWESGLSPGKKETGGIMIPCLSAFLPAFIAATSNLMAV